MFLPWALWGIRRWYEKFETISDELHFSITYDLMVVDPAPWFSIRYHRADSQLGCDLMIGRPGNQGKVSVMLFDPCVDNASFMTAIIILCYFANWRHLLCSRRTVEAFEVAGFYRLYGVMCVPAIWWTVEFLLNRVTWAIRLLDQAFNNLGWLMTRILRSGFLLGNPLPVNINNPCSRTLHKCIPFSDSGYKASKVLHSSRIQT